MLIFLQKNLNFYWESGRKKGHVYCKSLQSSMCVFSETAKNDGKGTETAYVDIWVTSGLWHHLEFSWRERWIAMTAKKKKNHRHSDIVPNYLRHKSFRTTWISTVVSMARNHFLWCKCPWHDTALSLVDVVSRIALPTLAELFSGRECPLHWADRLHSMTILNLKRCALVVAHRIDRGQFSALVSKWLLRKYSHTFYQMSVHFFGSLSFVWIKMFSRINV